MITRLKLNCNSFLKDFFVFNNVRRNVTITERNNRSARILCKESNWVDEISLLFTTVAINLEREGLDEQKNSESNYEYPSENCWEYEKTIWFLGSFNSFFFPPDFVDCNRFVSPSDVGSWILSDRNPSLKIRYIYPSHTCVRSGFTGIASWHLQELKLVKIEEISKK